MRYIDADDLITYLNNNREMHPLINAVVGYIEGMPTADVEPVKRMSNNTYLTDEEFKAYTKECRRKTRRTKLKLILKRPKYFLLAILTQRCPVCHTWFSHPFISRMNTAYAEDELNWNCMCKKCWAEDDAYWDELWKDYYNSCL